MVYRVVWFTTLVTLFTILACAQKPSQREYGYKEPPSIVPPQTTQAGWEVEWARLLREARKEGKVTVYAATPGPIIKEASPMFKKTYGVTIDLISARGSELRSKLFQERANSLFIADIIISGPGIVFGGAKKAGMTESLETTLVLPEVKDSRLWFGGVLPFLDEEKHALSFYAYPSSPITINTDLVQQGEIRSYRDLLAPRWKNKIALNDPTVTGTAFNGFSTFILNKVLDEEYFRQLVKDQFFITRDERLQVDWVARGRYPVGLWTSSSNVAEYSNAGAPLRAIFPEEGVYTSGNGGAISLLNRAPHPNAARVFINWILSKEGQQMMQDGLLQQSAREDLSLDKLKSMPEKIRQKGVKYFNSANENETWYVQEQEKYLKMSRDIFGPMLK